jgi:hypothetical protein
MLQIQDYLAMAKQAEGAAVGARSPTRRTPGGNSCNLRQKASRAGSNRGGREPSAQRYFQGLDPIRLATAYRTWAPALIPDKRSMSDLLAGVIVRFRSMVLWNTGHDRLRQS